jgi:hypothetical protein
LVSRNIYLSIIVIGFVFAILTLLTEQSQEIAITILYLTFVIISLTKFTEEWRYFRSYNAPIASTTFLVIPTLIALGGTFIAQFASLGEYSALEISIIELYLNIEFLGEGEFIIFLNAFSLIFIFPFFTFIIVLLNRYYSKRYPATFINRKKFPRELTILYNIGIDLVLIIFWFETTYIDLCGLLFIILTTLLFIHHYILRVLFIPVQREPIISRRSTRNSSQTQRSSRTSRTSTTRTLRPTTQRSSSIASSRQVRSSIGNSGLGTAQDGSISVVDGLSTETRTIKRIEKLSPAIVSSLTPVGQHLSRDDFRCIFCYEYPVEKEKKVVICPHCGHPAHDNELQKWLTVADICSRCNKKISQTKMVRVSGTNYSKIIKMFENNELSPRTR